VADYKKRRRNLGTFASAERALQVISEILKHSDTTPSGERDG
jgi:hypothetical protein